MEELVCPMYMEGKTAKAYLLNYSYNFKARLKMKQTYLFLIKKHIIYGAIALFSFYGMISTGIAQDASVPGVVHSVADNIIRNTSFKFVDRKSDTVYSTLESVPSGVDIKVQSRYSKWEYPNGVMMIGMLQASKQFNEKAYSDYVFKNFDFIFKNLNALQKRTPDNKRLSEWGQMVRMGSLDDCGAMAAALSDVNEVAKNKQYDQYLKKAADYILHKQQRLDDGTLCRNFPRKMTIWADDLYMSVPFLARMGRITGDSKYFDDAILQVRNFNKHLYDSTKGIYFHCWYSDVQKNGVAHWLRCNGWLAIAQVELLNNLPESHPARKELKAYLLRQIIGFSRFQDPSGLWHQIMDRPDSYLESSGTAMFIYAIAKAVNEHWIPSSYKTIAIQGWKGLTKQVRPDGKVENVCIGTGIEDNIAFYYNRPNVTNDFHVSGPILMAATEMAKLKY